MRGLSSAATFSMRMNFLVLRGNTVSKYEIQYPVPTQRLTSRAFGLRKVVQWCGQGQGFQFVRPLQRNPSTFMRLR